MVSIVSAVPFTTAGFMKVPDAYVLPANMAELSFSGYTYNERGDPDKAPGNEILPDEWNFASAFNLNFGIMDRAEVGIVYNIMPKINLDTTQTGSAWRRDNIENKLKTWRNEVHSGKYHCFQETYHALLNILKFKELDSSNKLHAAIIANLGRFSNLLGDYENALRLGGNKLRWNASNLKGLMWYLNLYATTAYEEQLSEDIRGIDAVQLTTIHQAKGLEWLVVFVPSLVNRRFPSSHVGEQKKWLISRDLFPADRYDLKEDDERRLFYVAVTRAKSTLVLSSFRRIKKSMKTSKFLDEVLKINPRIIEAMPTNQERTIDVDKSFIGMGEDEIFTFDAGEIVDYTRCPYFYRMRHVWNYDAPMNEQLGYGNALHYCLRRVVELHKEGYNQFSAVITAIDSDFYLPYTPDKKAERMRKGAKKMIMDYVADHLDDINSVTEVEYRLEFPRKRSTITGKVDVIIDKGGEIETREYKTSTKVTKPEQAELQVRLYALGLKGLGVKVRKGSVVYLTEGKLDPVEVDKTYLDRAKKRAEQILCNLHNQKYNPDPGDFCKICDYRGICKWSKKEGE